MLISDANSNQQEICIKQGKTEEEKKKKFLSLLQPLSTQHIVPAPLKAKLTKANLPRSGIHAHKSSLLITGHHKVHANKLPLL